MASNRAMLYFAQFSLFFGCIAASVAGAGEVFVSLYETYGIAGFLPALIISIILGSITAIASIFLFANSVKEVFHLPACQIPDNWKGCFKYGFRLFLNPINAIIETSCAFAALKEAGAPQIVLYAFAIMTLPLNYFFSENESQAAMGNDTLKLNNRVTYILGCLCATTFSVAMAFVTFALISSLIPVPGLNFAVAALFAFGYGTTAIVSMINAVKDIFKTERAGNIQLSFLGGCAHFFNQRKKLLSGLASACFASGTAAEVYTSLHTTLNNIPLLRSSQVICTFIAIVGAACFAAVNAMLAHVSFQKLMSSEEHDTPTVRKADQDEKTTHSDQQNYCSPAATTKHSKNSSASSLSSFVVGPICNRYNSDCKLNNSQRIVRSHSAVSIHKLKHSDSAPCLRLASRSYSLG